MFREYLQNKGQITSLLMALIVANQIIAYTPNLRNSYYYIQLLILVVSIGSNFDSVSIVWLSLLLICAISIIVNDIPAFYNIWQRWGIFVISLLLAGGILDTKDLRFLRIHSFYILLWLLSGITLLSSFSVLIGGAYYQGGYLCGITNHSMLLGIVANLSLVHLLYQYFNMRIHEKKQKYIFLAAILDSFIMSLSSGSRSALIGGVAGVLVFLTLAFREKLTMLARVAMAIILLLSISYSLWRPSLDVIIQKNGNIESLNLNSRQGKWDALWDTFKSNPIIGIGFATIELDDGSEGSAFTKRTGQIESGSSWLSVLSMTGIIGGLSMLSILIQSVHTLWLIIQFNRLRGAFLCGILTFFCIHMCAEGYIFSAGSMAFFIFWLLLGTIQAERQTLLVINSSS